MANSLIQFILKFHCKLYRASKKLCTILKIHSLLQMLKLSTIFVNTMLYSMQKAVLNIL